MKSTSMFCLVSLIAFAITGFAETEEPAGSQAQVIQVQTLLCDNPQYVKDFVENTQSNAELSAFAPQVNAEAGRQVCGTNVSRFIRVKLEDHALSKDGANVEIWSVKLLAFVNKKRRMGGIQITGHDVYVVYGRAARPPACPVRRDLTTVVL